MLKMSPDGSRSVWIRRLAGDFAERRSTTLFQGFCACCCCCVQAPVNAACGLVSGLLLPAAGPWRAPRPVPWPLRLRIAGASLIIGAAQGTTALFMWPRWLPERKTWYKCVRCSGEVRREDSRGKYRRLCRAGIQSRDCVRPDRRAAGPTNPTAPTERNGGRGWNRARRACHTA
jgi:hypothetical protein